MAHDALAANIKQGFTRGYRNREDVSTISPDILVSGSQNVLTNTYKRIASRPGYTLDGQRSTPNSGQGIYGTFDWNTHTGTERNIRVGFNETGTDGVVQCRYVAAAGDKYNALTFTEDQAYWIDLYSSAGLTFYACRFWDFTNELKDLMLWVDGSSNVFMWSGAMATLAETSWATGSVSVLAAAPTVAGTGYALGDTITITTGGTGATALVAGVGGSGAVTAVILMSPGTGYTTGAGKATTTTGAGINCTLNITTVAQGYVKINGTTTVGAKSFMSSGSYTQAVLINGNSHTYSAITGAGFYLVGLSADPTAEAVNSVIVQKPVVTANSAISGIPATFSNHIIENLNNQIYLSASDNNSVYVSSVNTFRSFTFSSPRKPGEGCILTLDGVPTCIRQQSDSMFISAGLNYWYLTKFQLSGDNINEQLFVVPIKTTANQAARSQALTTKIKNLIAFVSSEVQINTLGVSANFFTEPQVSDISAPIVHDVQNMDFTDGHVLYHQKYLYVTAPKEGKLLIYNMTQDTTDSMVDSSNIVSHYWEAPQTLPIGRLSIINGDLYGHSYSDSNTYKLFNGTSDDGKPYKCLALFAYDTYGDRTATKASNELFIEGYKLTDTVLQAYLRRGLNGPVASWKWGELPDRNIIPTIDDASIGKISIGKTSIGGTLEDVTVMPKFRLVETFNKSPFFEEQQGFGSEGIGQKWEIVSFSTNAMLTTEGQSSIYDPPTV